MSNKIELSIVLPASPRRLYEAWLDGPTHAQFTGGGLAEVDPRKGGKFSAWDGYIQGKTLELVPFRRILQTWRTTDFPDDAPDSRLEIFFEAAPGGTKLTLRHTDFPVVEGVDYEQGWKDYYFEPMLAYFSENKEEK